MMFKRSGREYLLVRLKPGMHFTMQSLKHSQFLKKKQFMTWQS